MNLLQCCGLNFYYAAHALLMVRCCLVQLSAGLVCLQFCDAGSAALLCVTPQLVTEVLRSSVRAFHDHGLYQSACCDGCSGRIVGIWVWLPCAVQEPHAK